MTQKRKEFARATTAIAAVLALSSTPALSQETVAPDPVADTTVEPTTAADAPAPASEPAPVATNEDATPSSPTADVAPAPSAAASSRSKARPAPRRASAPSTALAPTEQAEAGTAMPVPTAPVEPTPMPVAPPAPADSPGEALVDEDAVPIAVGAAFGLMALGAAGMAMRRRRRRLEDEEMVARQRWLDEHRAAPANDPAPAGQTRPAPAFVAAPTPRHDPVPVRNAPVTRLPDGFDLSRFGRHVQAAYRGPTADNPSLSLKYRLRRAAALDQQERRLAESQAAAAPAEEQWDPRPETAFLLRKPTFKRPEPHVINQ